MLLRIESNSVEQCRNIKVSLEQFFEALGEIEVQVNKLVTVLITDNQFDALVSFSYNVGTGNLKRSTLLRKLNMGDYFGAADEFPKWRKANGVILQGLVNRRADERALFLS